MLSGELAHATPRARNEVVDFRFGAGPTPEKRSHGSHGVKGNRTPRD